MVGSAFVILFFCYLTAIFGKSYDYIVVGAGTGGSAAAKRLSDVSAHDRHGRGPSVLVLEAGYNQIYNPATENFQQGFLLAEQPDFGFFYLGEGVPQLGGMRFDYPPARMWGGTSNINGALWVRGNEYDSQVYAKYGGPSWNWANNIATWVGLENFTGHTNCPSCHGYSGEINVMDQLPVPNPIWNTFKDAVQEAFPGLPVNHDYNGLSQTGIFRSWQLTVQNLTAAYIRESAATAFLQTSVNNEGKGLGKRDLTIISDALVTRLIFHKDSTRVKAVEYIDKEGEVKTVHVNKDVILAAGTIGTPQILQRSGVGDCAYLSSIGIECVVNSPYVGQNVQEHAIMQLIFETPRDLSAEVNAWNNAPSSNGFIFGGFAFSPYAEYYADPTIGTTPPDVELNWKVASLFTEDLNQLYGLDNFNQATNTPRAQPVISLGIYQPKPKCRGYVNITDPSPTWTAKTYFCFAGDTLLNGTSVDMAYYRWALKKSLEIVENMQEHNPGWKPIFPTPEMINNPHLIDQVVRATILSGWHPCGSTRMGAFDNVQQGVVDGPTLCVHGTENIRVADNSIYPETPTGNTQAWAYLAGARVAEFALAGECPGN